MSDLRVRDEAAGDRRRVHEIHTAAFGRPAEADLVDVLREAVDPQASLVAEEDGTLVGHVFFSPVTIENAPQACAAGLAPLGVHPSAQGHGVGGALVRAGLARCRALGWRSVFLLGDPAYYARFGFELAAPRGLHYVSEAFDRGFQCLELVGGSLAGCTGYVRYPEAFARI